MMALARGPEPRFMHVNSVPSSPGWLSQNKLTNLVEILGVIRARRTEVSNCQSLGNGDFGGNLGRIRGTLLAKVSPPATHQPAGPIPRHDRSKAGLNPLFPGSEVSEIFTTSVE
jgi:hypothetical protein